jgi:hypothetical protein
MVAGNKARSGSTSTAVDPPRNAGDAATDTKDNEDRWFNQRLVVEEETLILRECWYALQGYSSARLRFVPENRNDRTVNVDLNNDEEEKGRHSYRRGRNRGENDRKNNNKNDLDGASSSRLYVASPALDLMDQSQCHPMFANEFWGKKDGDDEAASLLPYWSRLGSGARDILQMIGQAGLAFRAISEFCKTILELSDRPSHAVPKNETAAWAPPEGADRRSYRGHVGEERHGEEGGHGPSSSSSSGIVRALAVAMSQELHEIRIRLCHHSLLEEEKGGDDDGGGKEPYGTTGQQQRNINHGSFLTESLRGGYENSTTLTLRSFWVSVKPILTRLTLLQMLCNSWQQHILHPTPPPPPSPSIVPPFSFPSSGGSANGAISETTSTAIRLLNLIGAQSVHGDTRTQNLCRFLWTQAVRPWWDALHAWLTEGILPTPTSDNRKDSHDDGGSNFFVRQLTTTRSVNAPAVAPQDLWRHGYLLIPSNVPIRTLTNEQVHAAFLIGKGINYLQTCLGENLRDLRYDKGYSHDSDKVTTSPRDDYGDRDRRLSSAPANVPTAATYYSDLIQRASLRVHAQILTSLRRDHSLLEHLLALKQFLLLGQGDFVSSFLSGVVDEFGLGIPDSRTTTQDRGGRFDYGTMTAGMYQHILSGILETSIKTSNASRFSNNVLRRLHIRRDGDEEEDEPSWVKKSPASSAFQESMSSHPALSVWEVISLSYTLPVPLVAIVPPSRMSVYRKMFRYLFAIRRIEMLLNLTWRQCSFLQREIFTIAQLCAIDMNESTPYVKANSLLRRSAVGRQAMMHFCNNLTSYLMYEVLETEWERLARSVESASTLDEIIEAHDEYLNCIHRKSLLSEGSTTTSSSRNDAYEDLGEQVQELLRLSEEFCVFQVKVFGDALESAAVASEKREQARANDRSGLFGYHVEPQEEETYFGLSDTSKLHSMEIISSVFNERVADLLKSLDSTLNGGRMRIADEESTVLGLGRGTSLIPTYQDDLDSLRFLEFQLNHNAYYSF